MPCQKSAIFSCSGAVEETMQYSQYGGGPPARWADISGW